MPLSHILGAFSYALDLAEGQPEGHCLRCCWMGTRIGEAIGLPPELQSDLYYMLLLKDLGGSSTAARTSQLYLADDRGFKQRRKLAGGDFADRLGFFLARIGPRAPMLKRLGAWTHVLRHGGDIARELMTTRAMHGAAIARRMRFSENVATAIAHLGEHWDGSGLPLGLAGDAISVLARIALLVQAADVQFMAHGPGAAREEVARQSGRLFDPELARTFLTLSARADFWQPLLLPRMEADILSSPAGQEVIAVDDAYLDEIASAFGHVIDAKSPYTHGHSARVGVYADAMARRLGFGDADRCALRRAAILHDIGKLGVSSLILDKPGKLNEAEWAEMRQHADHSRRILERVSVFRDMAMIASAHHERLDGCGYPMQLNEQSIGMGTRIITACDFFDALTAERSYRPAMSVERALDVMGAEVGRGVDAQCYDALLAHLREQAVLAA